MTCSGDVWSRAARRRKRQKLGDESAIVEEAAPERSAEVALAVSISCMEEKVEIRWLRGQERLLFESFCGKIKRALTVRE
jgi:23S rRNA (adenine1618-N6)-methyltransferase